MSLAAASPLASQPRERSAGASDIQVANLCEPDDSTDMRAGMPSTLSAQTSLFSQAHTVWRLGGQAFQRLEFASFIAMKRQGRVEEHFRRYSTIWSGTATAENWRTAEASRSRWCIPTVQVLLCRRWSRHSGAPHRAREVLAWPARARLSAGVNGLIGDAAIHGQRIEQAGRFRADQSSSVSCRRDRPVAPAQVRRRRRQQSRKRESPRPDSAAR